MGSYRSGRGGRGGRTLISEREKGSNGSSDFRWKKNKKRKRGQDMMFQQSGDSLPGDELIPDTNAPENDDGRNAKQTASEKKRAIRERQRNAKKRRREMHDQERENDDTLLRLAPEKYLWNKYVEWSGHKLTSVEKKVETWTAEQVMSVEEREGMRLMEQVKEVIGPDYIGQGNWKKKKGAVAGVACIVLAASAVRAVKLAKEVYDGRPVGKLFSKHIKIEEQREWLKRCCDKGLAPSAAGTARRVQRLVGEGVLTLGHTSVIVIDFSRDVRLRNIVDIEATRVELFEFLHVMTRELIAERKMRILLYVPRKQMSNTANEQQRDAEKGCGDSASE